MTECVVWVDVRCVCVWVSVFLCVGVVYCMLVHVCWP